MVIESHLFNQPSFEGYPIEKRRPRCAPRPWSLPATCMGCCRRPGREFTRISPTLAARVLESHAEDYGWIITWLVLYAIPPPLKNMSSSVGMILPNIWNNKTCSKPPTSYGWMITILELLRWAMELAWVDYSVWSVRQWLSITRQRSECGSM